MLLSGLLFVCFIVTIWRWETVMTSLKYGLPLVIGVLLFNMCVSMWGVVQGFAFLDYGLINYVSHYYVLSLSVWGAGVFVPYAFLWLGVICGWIWGYIYRWVEEQRQYVKAMTIRS